MKGVLGKIADDLFENPKAASGVFKYRSVRDAKLEHYAKRKAYNTYEYADKLGKYVGIGALSGGIGTLATNTYNNYTEGDALTDNIGVATLRGIALGAVGGAAVNAVPKVIKNQLGRTGIKPFEGGGEILSNLSEIWSPVAQEFASARKSGGSLDKMFKMVKEADKQPGEFAFNLQKSAIEKFNPSGGKGISLDEMVRFKHIHSQFKKSLDSHQKYLSGKQGGAAKDFMVWGQETFQDIGKLRGLRKAGVVGALATQMGFKSTYHHIVEPTGQLIDNLRKGKFKDITFGQGAAAAFTGYGLYETGQVINDAGEGDWLGVAGGLATIAGGKLMFGLAMDYAKLEAERMAKGISFGDMYKAHVMGKAAKKFGESSMRLSEEEQKEINQLALNKAKMIFREKAPNTSKIIEGESLFNAGVKLFQDGSLEAIKKDALLHGKDPVKFTEMVRKYRDDGNLSLMGLDIAHSNKENIMNWNTAYTNTLSELRKDFMNEQVDINYKEIVDNITSKDRSSIMTGVSDLASGSKWFAGRVSNLPGREPGPKYPGIKDPWMWGELGANFALGVGTTYGMDYLARGEDASIPEAVMMGGVIQLATLGHILGSKKYLGGA